MELDLGLLADDAIKDAGDKLYIFGEFRYIFAPGVPARQGRFAIVARFVADAVEVRDRESAVEIEIVDQDGNLAANLPRSPKIPLKFVPIGPANRAKQQAIIIVKLDGLILSQYGDHAIHFLVNGAHVGEGLHFHVVQLPAGGGTPATE